MNEQNKQSQQLLNLLNQQMNASTSSTPIKTQAYVATPVTSVIPPVVPETPLYSNGNGNGNGAHTTATNVVATPTVQSQPAVTAPVSNGAVDTSKMEAALMEVVSEKTGYPAEMLELNMDMEADLGIDSIKRVEIFGALTAQNPSMSDINPNELTELRTLGEIVSYVSSKKG